QKIFLNKPAPVLPTGFNQLLRAFDSDTLPVDKLAKIITGFPSIAARLIFLVNSAWASPCKPADNLETACLRLGFLMVRSISISLCIASTFEAINRCSAFKPEYFWCSSLLTAEAVTLLGSQTTKPTGFHTATLHTSGLLHNLGLLWLAGNLPEQTSQALLLAKQDGVTTLQALRSVIGADYCEIGGMLGRSWKFPNVLISAMEQHAVERYPTSNLPSTVLVGYAAELVSALQNSQQDRPPFPKQADVDFDPVDLDNIYGKLQDKFQDIQELARTMFCG
ncbi:MAG: HDOD domain-containing protein, partial [Methylomonas sp.]